jgi:IS1 family transposase
LVIRKKKEDNDQSDKEKSRLGRVWIWTAIDTPTRLMICSWIGGHELDDARKMQKDIVERSDDKPLFVTDELPHYATIFEEIFSTFTQVPPTGKPGRPKGLHREVDKGLIYATVKKTRKGGCIIKVERSIVHGTEAQVVEKLSHSPSLTINTSYIERSNSLWRLWDAHLARKAQTFAKNFNWLVAKYALCLASYNFIRPHER